MKTKPQMPTKQIALGELSGAVVLQTASIEGQTFAWLVEDERYLVLVEGEEKHEIACKHWLLEWFRIEEGHKVKVHHAKNEEGELVTIQIKQTNGLR
jgi:hypothetical protein